MAVILDQIALATEAAHPDLNNELLSQDCAAARLLQENQVSDEDGDPIEVNVRYKRNNGGWYDGYDQFDTSHVDQLAQGSLQWKSVHVNVTIDESTLVRNARLNIRDLMSIEDIRDLPTPSRKTVINIFGKEFANSIGDLRDLIATAIYSDGTGTLGKELTGFAAAIDNSLTYAGIAVGDLGTFDYNGVISGSQDNIWACKVKDASNASLDLSMIEETLSDASVGGHSPKWAFMPRDLYSSLVLMLEGTKVRESAEAAEIGFERNSIESIEYGCTFYRDEYCPANTIYFVNPDFLNLYVHPALAVVFSGFKEPTDQAAVTGQIKCMMQLHCSDRAKQAKITNVVK